MSDNPMRVLSLDGGPGPLVLIRVLAKLEKRYPGFLAKTDMFAGTSSGALISLFLAKKLSEDQLQGQKILDDCITLYTRQLFASFQPGALGWLRLMTGVGPLADGENFKKTLETHLGKETTLADLKKKVSILAFDASRAEGKTFTWSNIQGGNNPANLVNVATASASLPLFLPVYREEVSGSADEKKNKPAKPRYMLDGAATNNNPTLGALGDALLHMSWENRNNCGWDHLNNYKLIPRLKILSLGIVPFPSDDRPTPPRNEGEQKKKAEQGDTEDWGYWKLLFQKLRELPIRLIQSDADYTHRHTKTILGVFNYQRFQPHIPPTAVLCGLLGISPGTKKAMKRLPFAGARRLGEAPLSLAELNDWLDERANKLWEDELKRYEELEKFLEKKTTEQARRVQAVGIPVYPVDESTPADQRNAEWWESLLWWVEAVWMTDAKWPPPLEARSIFDPRGVYPPGPAPMKNRPG